ncbi:hypothetical protein [Thiothrix unzii]|uniref:Uncharacterized protein n=1 Tax=Thiothrix unzii TaxID=111769 RepID=A0A975FD18_9GAMM|nr:hypothetical protein [Thiothrix unzii]QTR55403.1 hypothetical protein J9260_18085 [Thiothrix unzii]
MDAGCAIEIDDLHQDIILDKEKKMFERKIFAIKGNQDVGKTTSLRLAYKMLLEQLENIPISYQVKYDSYQYSKSWAEEAFMDFTAVFTISGYVVILHSPGDNAWFVNCLREYHDKSCLIIVCATRKNGNHGSVRAFNEFAQEYGYHPDAMLKNELSESDNKEKAQQLLKRIGTALGEALESSESPEKCSELQTTLLRKLADSLKTHP